MSDPTPEQHPGPDAPRIVVVSQDGRAVPGSSEPQERGERPVTELIEEPAKVMRIGSMVKQLLEEVRSAPLDDASRARLREIHASSLKELEDGLAPELVEELGRISLPFSDTEIPSDAELRVAQAQLVGWLEGLFHGIQTAMFVQQMEARAALEAGGRRALPGGMPPGTPPGPGDGQTGQYL